MPLAQLLKEKTAVDEAIMALGAGGGAAVAASKPKAKRVTQGSAWADFTKKVTSEQVAEYTAFKEAAESKLGVAPKFVAAYRDKHQEEWTAFQAEWNAAHPKLSKEEKAASVAASVASVASTASDEEAEEAEEPKKR